MNDTYMRDMAIALGDIRDMMKESRDKYEAAEQEMKAASLEALRSQLNAVLEEE